MTYEEKLEKVLYKLAEERKLTRKGHKTKVDLNDRSFTKVRIKDTCRILLQLQDDEKALIITTSSRAVDRTHPDFKDQEDNEYWEKVDQITVELDEKFDKWLRRRKRVERTMNNLLSDKKTSSAKGKTTTSDFIYKITYGADQRIIVNNLFELSRPNFDSENANVFELLYSNPGKKYTLQKLESEIEQKLTKNLSKIVENLGFSKDLKRVFFQTSKISIIFHNPISKKRLDSLNIQTIKL